MQKIGASTNTANPSGEFTEGNPAAGIAATLLKAQWLNAIQRELVRVVEAAGLTLDAADDSQILKAIQTIQERANSWLKLTDKPTTVAGFGITDVFTKAETTTAIQQKVAALVDSSPAALDTLRELAAALGNDPNFATTMANALAAKANKATTLGGYGIADAYTKSEVDTRVGTRPLRDAVTTIGLASDNPEYPYMRRESDGGIYYLQSRLGFTPIQQGTGLGQGTNAVKIGWSNDQSSKLRLTVDNSDIGYFLTSADLKPADYIKKGQYLNPGESPGCITPVSGSISAVSGSSGGLEVRGSGGAAIFSFHRPGAFGVNFGLDTDNQLKVGGWSMGGVAHTIWHSGNRPRDTASLGPAGWTRNADTGEIIQWVEVPVGDFTHGKLVNVTWPFQFPTQLLNVITSFRQASGSGVFSGQAVYSGGTQTGCTLRMEEWSATGLVQDGLVVIVTARGF